MFRVILFTQWKWTRLALLPGVVIAFSLPILSVQGATESIIAIRVLQTTRTWAVWFPALAALLGLMVGVTAWREDHRGSHVYALSLPVERWRYVLLRFAAGAVLLAAPIVALWFGSLIATAAASIPPTLRAYPNALALRFALAALVAYGIFFAISAGTVRTAAYALGLVAVVLALDVLLRAAGVEFSIGREAMAWLTRTPGPLTVFTGRWMVIDV